MSSDSQWDPEGYARHARFVSDLGAPVLDLLDPRPGEHILDLGCGDGALTKRLVDRGCTVVGVDASQEMIAAAKAEGLDAQLADGQQLAFDNEFDAVFSNAALHWMPRADDVIAGVRRALKTGGRFVGEFGGNGNVARIVAALKECLVDRGIEADGVNPWYFPSPEEYRERLESWGFTVSDIRLIPRPTPLPSDMAGWLGTFAQAFIALVPEDERADYVAEVVERCRPQLWKKGRGWVADYVRLRFRAVKVETV